MRKSHVLISRPASQRVGPYTPPGPDRSRRTWHPGIRARFWRMLSRSRCLALRGRHPVRVHLPRWEQLFLGANDLSPKARHVCPHQRSPPIGIADRNSSADPGNRTRSVVHGNARHRQPAPRRLPEGGDHPDLRSPGHREEHPIDRLRAFLRTSGAPHTVRELRRNRAADRGAHVSFREIPRQFLLTIARWLTTSTMRRSSAENYTTPGDVTSGIASASIRSARPSSLV